MNLRKLAAATKTGMQELVQEGVSSFPALSLDQIEHIVATALSNIESAVARGESVKLRSFGTFERRQYDDRQIMNPGTKTTEKLAARYAVKFIPSGSLKDAVRGDLL